MKTFLLFLIVLISSFCRSQEDVKIIHYLKKSSECSLQFPGNSFTSEGLKIPIVDSLFSAADVTVKKVKQPNLQLSNYKIFVQNDTVIGVSLILKSKKSKMLFDSYLNNLGAESSPTAGECLSKVITVNGRDILLTKVILGKKWGIELAQK